MSFGLQMVNRNSYINGNFIIWNCTLHWNNLIVPLVHTCDLFGPIRHCFPNLSSFYDVESVPCQSPIWHHFCIFNTTRTNVYVRMTCQLLASRTHQSLCVTSYNRHTLFSHSCFVVRLEQVDKVRPKSAVRCPCAIELICNPDFVPMSARPPYELRIYRISVLFSIVNYHHHHHHRY